MSFPKLPVTSWWALAIVVALPVAVWAGRKILDKLLECYDPAPPGL